MSFSISRGILNKQMQNAAAAAATSDTHTHTHMKGCTERGRTVKKKRSEKKQAAPLYNTYCITVRILKLTMLVRSISSAQSLACRLSKRSQHRILLGSMGSTYSTSGEYPVVCDPQVMSQKAHGSCPNPVVDNLRWNCDHKTADNICCFNRHYAEHSGYFEYTSSYLKEVDREAETTYYDSVTGKPLFIAPRGRPFSAFLTVGRCIVCLATTARL